ncbi:MAG: M13 family metallopeptidase [Rhizomicrobium sp.]|jgi:predicted metalloendopeptidase
MKIGKLGLTMLACTAGIAVALAQTPANRPEFGSWGVDLSSIDTSVKPGDDFFLYVNGKWFATAEIPADRTSTGNFDGLEILSEKRMKNLAAGLDAKPYTSLNPEERKLRDLYDAFNDTKGIDARGLAPAKADLARIAALKTYEDVARVMAAPELQSDGPFADRVTPDPKNSNAYIVTLGQSGLGLPNRDYYLRDDPALAKTRDAYRVHLVTMLKLAGIPDAAARADAVYNLETAMAKVEWASADRRDAVKTYNPMKISELVAFAPGFPWETAFKTQGISRKGPNGERTVIVRENTAFVPLAKLFATTPVAVWRDYLTAHYLHTMAAYLPASVDDADFDFYGKVLGGQAEQKPRETRAAVLVDQRLGDALGKLYVAQYFPPESKAKIEQLVSNLLKAYDADIRTIPWMTEATRQKALEKLHKFTPHVGYTDKWRDYSRLDIRRNDLLGDVKRSNTFEWRYRLDRLDQPVDRNEWNMTPPTVNAYYTQSLNSIFFPAAILQPPFFDPNADDAVNYGGIGAVIGHEISHGFDDQGSKYDGDGNLISWWTDEDRKNFDARTTALGAQFDSYEPLPGLHVNGKLTMGENIGDLSGLSIALKAYHISLGGKPAPVIDGYTGDQRFFLSYGQIWRAKLRDAETRRLVLSNPHSPEHFRPIGATRNVDAWYDAFDVKPGDKYYLPPDQRVKLW